MRVGQAFSKPGKTLKAADLGGREVRVTIESVQVQDLGEGERQERKPVVYFRGKERGLALNRTNATTITNLLGTDEMDQWVGAQIVLFPAQVEYQGRQVEGIRVKGMAPQGRPGGQPTGYLPPPPPPRPAPPREHADSDWQPTDDDVPF